MTVTVEAVCTWARVYSQPFGLRGGLMVWVASILFVLGCRAADDPPYQRDATAEQVLELCTQCHGAELEGNPEVAAPSIAGLPEWYVERQLHKFKDGIRGAHFDDVAGMRMRPMAMSLTVADIVGAAARVAGMPVRPGHDTLQDADPDHGKTLYMPCTACHGPEAKGNQELNAPPLAQANSWYLMTQLKNFKHGVRGANPRDTTGAQMMPMAQGLADEQAMRDVLAYIDTL